MMAIFSFFAAAVLCAGPATTGVVTVGDVPAVTVSSGDSTTVVVPIKIAEGLHVQANPASGEFLIPLTLYFALEDTGLSATPEYPAPALYRLEGTSDDLLTYHGEMSLPVVIRAAARAAKGERRITGELRYQACDARRCFFPASVPVVITVIIGDDPPPPSQH